MAHHKIKNQDPTDLTDTDLDIQVGVLQAELDAIDQELAGLTNVEASLLSRRIDLELKLSNSREVRGNRGQGQGNGNN